MEERQPPQRKSVNDRYRRQEPPKTPERGVEQASEAEAARAHHNTDKRAT